MPIATRYEVRPALLEGRVYLDIYYEESSPRPDFSLSFTYEQAVIIHNLLEQCLVEYVRFVTFHAAFKRSIS